MPLVAGPAAKETADDWCIPNDLPDVCGWRRFTSESLNELAGALLMTASIGFGSFGGISIRPVLEQDILWLYDMETHPAILQRYRLNGMTPSPKSYAEFYRNGNSTAYIVYSVDTGQRIGMVYTFGTDFSSRRTSIGVVAHPSMHGVGHVYRGLFLLADYLFSQFPIDQIFGQAPEYNFEQYSSKRERRMDLSSLFQIDSVLGEDTYMSWRWWDKYVFSISSQAFMEHREMIIAYVDSNYLEEENQFELSGRHGTSSTELFDRHGFDLTPLKTSHATMRVVRDADLPWLSQLFSCPQNRGSQRIGAIPPIAEISGDLLDRMLWDGVLCQFIVEENENHIPLALLSASNVVWNNLYLSMSVTVAQGMLGDLVIAGAIRKFIDYVFATFCIRKIYIQYRANDQTLAFIRESLIGGGTSTLRTEGEWDSGAQPAGEKKAIVSSIFRSEWMATSVGNPTQ
jgi:RimJ/RimL family protein N-acetyltransferase